MKRAILLCFLILFLTGTATAANHQDTLWVRADTANDVWIASTMFEEQYEQIDEQHVADDGDYIYRTDAGAKQDWKLFDFPDTTGKIVDSVEHVGRAEYYGGDDGTAAVNFLRRWWDPEFEGGTWVACYGGAGWDTVELTTDYVNYSKMHTVDPCGSAAWQWKKLIDSMDGYKACWGVMSHSVRTGSPAFSNRVSWSFNVVYSQSEDEPGSQVIIIGARPDEEDYHNPRCGIPPAAWK